MNKRIGCAALALLLMFTLAACGDGDADIYSSESDYLPSIAPPLDVAITDCLSSAQVSIIMDRQMLASEPYEDGTWVMYMSDDGLASVSVSMENATEAVYDAMIAELTGGETVEDLSARTYWYPTIGEMIDFCEGYSIAVTVTDPSVANTYGLCHAVVKTMRNNLQAE